MALINDTIDQLSYEVGEASGYVDGSRTGYEYGYHDCMLDLVKRHNHAVRSRTRKIKQLLYFTKQKLWGVALLHLTILTIRLINLLLGLSTMLRKVIILAAYLVELQEHQISCQMSKTNRK